MLFLLARPVQCGAFKSLLASSANSDVLVLDKHMGVVDNWLAALARLAPLQLFFRNIQTVCVVCSPSDLNPN